MSFTLLSASVILLNKTSAFNNCDSAPDSLPRLSTTFENLLNAKNPCNHNKDESKNHYQADAIFKRKFFIPVHVHFDQDKVNES